MRDTRKTFKSKLRWCHQNENQIKLDILATHNKNKDFKSFWKHTKSLEAKPYIPASVEGECEPGRIAELFKEHFKVVSPLSRVSSASDTEASRSSSTLTLCTGKEIAKIIKGMKRGKSPGHDGLSIEHLQHAGDHLPRVLSLLFNLCVSHTYLPPELMKTVVVPIIKNKTGDASDRNNYRPISLATVVAKVLDGLLDRQLSKCMKLNDAQFGFRPKLSTETAVLRLKHTVQYYTNRRTPVYACFLDLSKAFDLVSYDLLWEKLRTDTDTPSEIIDIFRYWYNNQSNTVRWVGSYSTPYSLDCGVRQGGLSSPRLFNIYVNGLIDELSGADVGCSIDNNMVNNISYADDMALLAPSVRALNVLLSICERYAVTHGLRYNAKKSELLVFKAGNKTPSIIPPVMLGDVELNRVTHFKYLGHWVTEDLSDVMDMERERRALAVRCNMLVRRFAGCTKEVKLILFKSYCQSFYTSSLWTSYTQKAYNALRIQYNNGFRMLLGLPRRSSESGMFAEARVDDFYSLMRKRVASLMHRVMGSSNQLLSIIVHRLDCPVVRHWNFVHTKARTASYNIKFRAN